MSKTLKIALISVIFGLLFSCTNESPVPVEEAGIQKYNENFVGIDEALQRADAIFRKIDGESTRSARIIKNTQKFRFPTRADSENSLYGFYIVNYENNSGFALLSADRRRAPVYAISEEGSLNLDDTCSNPGLSWYLNTCLTSSDLSHQIDTTTMKFEPINPGFDFTDTICKPLLKEFMAKFHQNLPYGQYCSNQKVGCAPLAIGTIMGYYEWPEQYSEVTFPWKSMKNNNQNNNWGKLFEILGRPENLNAIYYSNRTSVVESTQNIVIPKTFQNFGYKGCQYSNFNIFTVKDELMSKSPIYVSGIEIGNEKSGHAWILDGLFTHSYEIKSYIEGESSEYRIEHFLHCVWGYYGLSNGYYYYGTSIGGTANQYDDGKLSNLPSYNNLKIAYGYRPNK